MKIENERVEKIERKYYGNFKRCALSLNLNTLREDDSTNFSGSAFHREGVRPKKEWVNLGQLKFSLVLIWRE